MKTNLTIIFVIILSFTCKAQVLNIYQTLPSETPPNAYRKDIQNFQNQYIGTWVYQNGQEYLEVRFIKKEMVWMPEPTQFYEDFLIGEYKYIDKNGVLRVNSLPNLNINHTDIYKFNLLSIGKLKLNTYPPCPSCQVGTERLYLDFDEPANDDFSLDAGFVIRRVTENGVEKLKVQFYHENSASGRKKGNFTQSSTFTEFSLPYGEYTLIKQ